MSHNDVKSKYLLEHVPQLFGVRVLLVIAVAAARCCGLLALATPLWHGEWRIGWYGTVSGTMAGGG